MRKPAAHFHLPGLFEFYEFYRAFLPLYRAHRAYFTIGARLLPSTAHRKAASGAAGASVPALRARRRYWR